MTQNISGEEAHLLCFAIDKYLDTKNGKVRKAPPGYSFSECQALRDRLVAAHKHPEGEADGYWQDARSKA